MTDFEKIRTIVEHFQIKLPVTEILPWGNGLINDTFRVNTAIGRDYLLQRMNRNNYENIPGMMENIYTVTEMLRKKGFFLLDGKQKESLYLIHTVEDHYYYEEENGDCWRMYNFMKRAHSLETMDSPENAYKAGLILGQFHELLADYPVEKMHIVTPDFHDPVKYYEKLKRAMREDRFGRMKEAEELVPYLRAWKGRMEDFNELCRNGSLPIRANHNDPKINNFMIDNITDEPICMVDLDTLMPGILPFDFGDGIRSCMCTGKDKGEDTDYEAVCCDMEIFNSYYNGFVEGTHGIMTKEEAQALKLGALLITIESAVRYLTDYLNGDVYLKVKYPTQNLVKARMHIRLALDMEKKLV